MYSRELKAEAIKRIRKSRETKRAMTGISPSTVARMHGINYKTVIAMMEGKAVKCRYVNSKLQEKLQRDLMRYADLYKDFESLDAIAADLGVSRRCISKWTKEIKLSSGKKRTVGEAVRNYMSEPDAAVTAFLTMRLSGNPCGLAGYY